MLISASADVRQGFTEVTLQTSCVSCLSSSEYFESGGLDPLRNKQCILSVFFCCLFAYPSVFFFLLVFKNLPFSSFPMPRSLTLPCLSKTIKQEQANVNPWGQDVAAVLAEAAEQNCDGLSEERI